MKYIAVLLALLPTVAHSYGNQITCTTEKQYSCKSDIKGNVRCVAQRPNQMMYVKKYEIYRNTNKVIKYTYMNVRPSQPTEELIRELNYFRTFQNNDGKEVVRMRFSADSDSTSIHIDDGIFAGVTNISPDATAQFIGYLSVYGTCK